MANAERLMGAARRGAMGLALLTRGPGHAIVNYEDRRFESGWGYRGRRLEQCGPAGGPPITAAGVLR